ncbi:MAG: Uma2 family endonuclease [Pyrinomonadaceae bacterium MAG19_C2-C3]|nr:Uma2 family endonuclease [Pyrinomonadaceae bacterium MAG19_C2-C3]
MSTTLEQTKLMTADELFEMPDDDFCYELVRGELKRMAPAGGEHGAKTMNLAAPLKVFVDVHNLGVVFAAETGFILEENPDLVRAPDIAFVQREHIPSSGVPKGYVKGAPDLAVEVVSPNDKLYEVDEKVDDYLAAGTLTVCIVYPKRRTVTVHRPNREPQILNINDTLDLSDVVTGFTLSVNRIFT